MIGHLPTPRAQRKERGDWSAAPDIHLGSVEIRGGAKAQAPAWRRVKGQS